MRRCKCCIMPETVGGVTFNEEGVCNFCQSYQEPELFAREALDRIVSKVKSKNNAYDCIVPMSGGRDSTYVLYLAKKLLGLKVLAVNYDNEFRNDQAVVNMKKACGILDVDFFSIRSKRDIATKMVKHNMLCSDLTRVLGVCRACTYGYRSIVYSTAVQHKVPLILWGDSQLESTKKLEQKAKQMARQKQTRTPRFFNSDFYKYEYFFLLQRMEFPMPGKILPTRSTALKRKDIRQISVFDYIPWNRMTIKETITNELGWEKPAGSVSTWRTDCRLGAVVNYCFSKVYGCTKNCLGFCSMVRAGQMDREEALREEEQMLAIVHKGEELKRLLRDRIGLSEKEMAKVLSLKTIRLNDPGSRKNPRCDREVE